MNHNNKFSYKEREYNLKKFYPNVIFYTIVRLLVTAGQLYKREFDKSLSQKLLETICGIASVDPDSCAFIFIGVAGKESDAKRIKESDNIDAASVGLIKRPALI